MTIAQFLIHHREGKSEAGGGTRSSSEQQGCVFASHLSCFLLTISAEIPFDEAWENIHTSQYLTQTRALLWRGLRAHRDTNSWLFLHIFKAHSLWVFFFFGKPQLCLVREIKPSLSVGSVLGEDCCWELVLLMPVVFYCQANCNAWPPCITQRCLI